MNVKKMLNLAANIARLQKADKNFFLGAVAIRNDGVMVSAYNGAPKFPTPQHHCEFRICRKLDKGAVVYLARTTADGTWALSKPCHKCEMILRKTQVHRVYYTIGPNEFACMILKNNTYRNT